MGEGLPDFKIALSVSQLPMPKDIRVFISSTCKDLKQDCRSWAIEIIDRTKYAEPIAMERWYEDYGHTEEVCLEKLEHESTHFLGIFAHRYGWRPNGPTDTSITEKEFNKALNLGRKMLILIPEEGSPIHAELWTRAEDQTDEDKAAQKAFTSRVSRKICRHFKNIADLVGWVGCKLSEWQLNEYRLRAIADAAKSEAPTTTRDFSTLGRHDQLTKFEDRLRALSATAPPRVACFLIHGISGLGHEEMLDRLQKRLCEDPKREVYPIRANVSAPWRGKDLAALLNVIGEDMKESFDSVEALARRLKTEMTRLDVVIRFDDLQGMNSLLTEFIEGFWKPLAKSFSKEDAKLSGRLIGLAEYKERLPGDCDQNIFRPDSGEKFDNTRLIALPELTDFTKDDLVIWLQDQELTHDTAEYWAETLLRYYGGNPSKLFHALTKNNNIWKK